MKKIILATCLLWMGFNASAQKEDGGKPLFKKENLFTGGDITLAFYTGGTTLGASPFFGYSLTKWLDVALNFNFVYQGVRDIYENKLRQFTYGPGVFVRIFPINDIFIQAQYEHNFISSKLIYNSGFTENYNTDVNSLLLGGGYTSNRGDGEPYFYATILFDALQFRESPYVTSSGQLVPVFKTGVVIPLFQGGGGRSRSRR